MTTTVRIKNVYADREHIEKVTVPSPKSLAGNDVAEWWNEAVFPHTGDGRGGYSVVTAKVTESDMPVMVGKSWAWEG